MSVTLDLARRYAALGLSVIPVRPREKKPALRDWKQFQTARATDADLVSWFDTADRNAGIVLGAVSGVVVIDSDKALAESWCIDSLPPTPMMTRSARGHHRYFRLPEALRDDGSMLPAFVGGALKIELRRDGQYVLAPGSTHPNGTRYEMVEDWPDTLDAVPELPPAIVIDAVSVQASPAALPASIGAGQRNTALWTEACRLRRLGLDADEILGALEVVNAKRCTPPLPDADLRDIAKRAAEYAPAKDLFPVTESGDAEFFAALFAESLRFDHVRGRWLLFDRHLWTPQRDGDVPRFALEAIRARQRSAVGDKDRMLWAVRGESRTRQNNLIALAQNIKPLADDGLTWDADPMLLGVANGVIDLRDGTLRDGRSCDRITMQSPVPFDLAASCPTWDQFLADVFDDADVIRYIQRAIGYSLTGDCREECLFFCWGIGANGKGTLMNTVASVFGDYADDLPFSALELRERSGIPNDIAKLVGKRYVTASESGETTRLNEARVKALTGRDPVTARFLHQEYFTFQPVAKFWLATNRKPIVRDDSAGFWRRLHLIPFSRSFVGREDRTLKDRLRAEAPGILVWAVRGALDWQRDGLQPPALVTQATEEYRRESDSLSPFYDACCVIHPNAQVRASDLFERYSKWFPASGLRPEERLNQSTFGKQVKGRFGAIEKRHTVYLGIGLAL